MATSAEAGSEALHRLKSTDPPQWLAPNTTLSQTARAASQHLFSSLRPYTPKSPFERLLVEGFDAEQIWQQIDLQSQPLMSSIRRELKRFEKDPEEIRKLKLVVDGEEKVLEDEKEKMEVESDELGEDLDGFDEELDDDDEEEEEDEEEGGEDEDEDGKAGNEDGGIEDKFLKLKDLEEFMEDDEEREYGLKKKDNKKKAVDDDDDEDEDEDSEGEREEEEDSDEIGEFGLDEYEDEEADKLESARYEDFFVGEKNKSSKRKSSSGDSGKDDEGFEDKKTLSTHEKEREKLKSKIELMEKANLEPKTWTMQGEVTAAKRPKNSALEVDIDFEHNVRPPPVITEEVTASLEELIKKRILDGHYDDVQKPLALPSKAPREIKELDENKSKKGLAEIYEEEYVQKTNIASAPLSFVEEEKQEASMLFKKLCLKLDALSHFHFTPKPVIEDMSVQANVPALAMEEIAPLAVSDAAMLAPEEVFSGKGDIKEESELTQAERKRRRANKKRKFKAEVDKRMANKPRDNALSNSNDAEAANKMTKKARDGT
ncbi:U3 small nucleolar ribonucleoprotein complex, subunit Mpp [Parasponia andersonii]|uniref:U3 small nucleolar ribonucleoprotein protein MPP10 n=1 Tax=Parasponia andersonii TaxID=3476 RepID=A0A2P5DFZ4_PARAD|nr:U3 small nucleolar ribonucleoprotein complex, subunit Mpp [Parasponia andersonii]